MPEGGKAKRFCVFCGQKPDEKTMEHVIPKWLIQMTGSPNRRAYFGLDVRKKAERSYAFDQFRFPACAACNGKFSELENHAKRIVSSMLDNAPLAEQDLDLLLDWLDKVRVGLWLAIQYLDKNPWGISPHFHIETRIGAYDRLVVISRTDYPKKFLSWIGTDLSLFQFMPSCFALCVNNLVFFNMSSDLLLAKRLGFPFPKKFFLNPDTNQETVQLRDGHARVRYPALKYPLKINGTQFFQCLFKYTQQHDSMASLYETPYVRENCLDSGSGKSRIFMRSKAAIVPYPQVPSREWRPLGVEDYVDFIRQVSLRVLELQNCLLQDCPAMELATPEQKVISQTNFKNAIKINKMVINELKRAGG